MTAVRPTLSRQAFVAVAGFSALLLAVILWSVGYLVVTRSLQNEFEVKAKTLDTLKHETLPKLGGNVSTVPSAEREQVIPAPTETVAASEFHKIALASLERAGSVVHSIQAEATTDVVGDGLRRLNAQITFDGSIEALQRVLFDLETGKPFIFIDSITVQPASTGAPGGRFGDALRVTLVASSYWKSFGAAADRR